ncbi:MAG: hypothetical protein A3H51_00235 [Candidatus Spechtbacteria bacterium RIFCSPLOWO2_02_FULL_38_8]|uniref:Uncharacterized protein n=1 Tax=Candidatus Spechtbacteria bacterium RIFCSPLOWO2_02_FULL_38_8 TaxID=1802164 RepID=A0A1G2HH55_9BACT|nr:MAG: hypothetical protein A3H51_00235 [Candidatus Spechtbacteria bacterium RIFCSPLOWO2_02_FULL_38_8]
MIYGIYFRDLFANMEAETTKITVDNAGKTNENVKIEATKAPITTKVKRKDFIIASVSDFRSSLNLLCLIIGTHEDPAIKVTVSIIYIEKGNLFVM